MYPVQTTVRTTDTRVRSLSRWALAARVRTADEVPKKTGRATATTASTIREGPVAWAVRDRSVEITAATAVTPDAAGSCRKGASERGEQHRHGHGGGGRGAGNCAMPPADGDPCAVDRGPWRPG